MPGENEKLIRFLESIKPSTTPESLSKKEARLNVRFDPERQKLIRTDTAARTKKAWNKLLRIVSTPTYGKTDFDFIDFAGLLDLDEAEGSVFFQTLDGFRHKESGGQIVGYTLVNREKAIASLKQIIQECEEKVKEKERQERAKQEKKKRGRKKQPKPFERDYSLSTAQIAEKIMSDPELKTKLEALLSDREVTIGGVYKALRRIYHLNFDRLAPIPYILEEQGIITETRKDKRGYYYYKFNK